MPNSVQSILHQFWPAVQGGQRAIIFNRVGGLSEGAPLREGLHVRVPWFQWPIIYDIRARPNQVKSPTGTKGDQYQIGRTGVKKSIAFWSNYCVVCHKENSVNCLHCTQTCKWSTSLCAFCLDPTLAPCRRSIGRWAATGRRGCCHPSATRYGTTINTPRAHTKH